MSMIDFNLQIDELQNLQNIATHLGQIATSLSGIDSSLQEISCCMPDLKVLPEIRNRFLNTIKGTQPSSDIEDDIPF